MGNISLLDLIDSLNYGWKIIVLVIYGCFVFFGACCISNVYIGVCSVD